MHHKMFLITLNAILYRIKTHSRISRPQILYLGTKFGVRRAYEEVSNSDQKVLLINLDTISSKINTHSKISRLQTQYLWTKIGVKLGTISVFL